MHFLGRGTAGRSHSLLGSVLIWFWMHKASSAGACITSLHSPSGDSSVPKQIFSNSENFVVVKMACNIRSHVCSHGTHLLQEPSSVVITAKKIHESCRNELVVLSRKRLSCRHVVGLNAHSGSVLWLQVLVSENQGKKITLHV